MLYFQEEELYIMVDSLHASTEVNNTEVNANDISNIGLGQLVIGATLEIGSSTKGGITTKANYYRLTPEQKKELVNAKLITSSKDKVDFAVNVKAIDTKGLIEFILENVDVDSNVDSKVITYLKDTFYATYKEMANAAYNAQSKVIKLELLDCVEFATMARSRTRKAISFTGEYFKLIETSLIEAMISYARDDVKKIISFESAKKIMQTIKMLLTIEQMIPTEKQLDTLAGIFSHVTDTELSSNLGAVIQLKNELFNRANEGDLEDFI
jgi:hypothetical protein